MRAFRVVFTLCSGVLATSLGHAQSTSSTAVAQGLFDEARTLMAAGKPAEACPKFEESQRLDPGSGTLLNLARCYEQIGRTASAWSAYLDAASAAHGAGNLEREKGARERAEGLAPKVSRLVIEVALEARVDGLRITRDGADVGAAQWGVALPTDEGTHEIVAAAPGFRDFRTTVAVEGQGKTVRLSVPKLEQAPLAASPPPGPAADSSPVAGDRASEPAPSGLGAQRIAALVAGGVGVAGVVVGTIFGLQTISKKKQASETCTGGTCTSQAGVDAGNDAHAAGNVSTVAMIVGAAGLAGGAVLWFTAPSSPSSTKVGLGLDGVQVRGAF